MGEDLCDREIPDFGRQQHNRRETRSELKRAYRLEDEDANAVYLRETHAGVSSLACLMDFGDNQAEVMPIKADHASASDVAAEQMWFISREMTLMMQ